MNAPEGTAPLGPSLRYTVRLGLRPDDRPVEYVVVTAMGELKAAAVAALRHARLEPESFIVSVEIAGVETEFTIDPARDLLDYWEVS